MDRRTFLRNAAIAPAIITTPGLLMPVREIVQPKLTLELLMKARATLDKAWGEYPTHHPFLVMTEEMETRFRNDPEVNAWLNQVNVVIDREINHVLMGNG